MLIVPSPFDSICRISHLPVLVTSVKVGRCHLVALLVGHQPANQSNEGLHGSSVHGPLDRHWVSSIVEDKIDLD